MNIISRVTSALLALALLAGIAVMMRPHPVFVDIAAVTRGRLEQKVIADGRARVRERYTVSAPVTGTLARIELHEGDVVEPGGVLARLLPLPSPLLDSRSRKVAEQRLASAIDSRRQTEAAARRAEALNAQSHRELARISPLAKEGTLSPAELDRAAADARMREEELSSARFSEKVAAHDVEQARAALSGFASSGAANEQFEVTSPVHGQVLHVLHKSEGVVEAGTALIELGDPAALELVVDVLSEDAVAIKPGMRARLLHWGGATPLPARVRRVEPAAFTKISALGVEEQRVNVLLDPDGSRGEWAALGDGFAAEFEITVWSSEDALHAPTSALFRRGDGWGVFAVKDGRAAVREVQVGHRGALETEILGGLKADDIVVIHPGASVHDGVKVSSR